MHSVILLLCIIGSSQVRQLSTRGLSISFSMDKLSVQDYAFSDAVWLNTVGEPNLPSLIYKIGIPQDGDVEVTLNTAREETMTDIEIDPVMWPGIYEPPLPEPKVRYGDVYKENRYFPQNVIEVGKPAYFRDIYTIEIRLNPIRYNPITKTLKVVNDIKISVTFKGQPKEKPITDTSFDEIYKRTIVNYEQCKAWRREPTLAQGEPPFSSGVWYKIEVDEEGLYRIDHDEITSAGLDPAQFDPKTMKIYTAAFDLLPKNVHDTFADSLVEVPVYVKGEDDNSFDRADYLVFYGFPASHFVSDTTIGWFENGYARKNVYWFTFGGEEGKRMERLNAAWNGDTPDTVVDEILHFEEDLSNPTRSGTNWYWEDVSPGDLPGVASVPIQHPKAQGTAQVTVGIYTLNFGTFIYQFDCDGEVFFYDTLSLPKKDYYPPLYVTGTGVLTNDSSVLNFSISKPIGSNESLRAYFNNIDMQYERLTDLKQPFHAFYQEQEDYTVKCTDASATPFVLDITDLRQPKMFDNYTLDNSTMILSSSSDSFQLLYFSKPSLAKQANLVQINPGNLRIPSEGCEYLVITHGNFYNAIMPLVEYRSREYLTKVVTIDEIYDDFSFGKYDPLAIKHFLYYTTNNWTTVPTYVLLVGDGTYDYKNNLVKDNPPNFIPMYESGTTLSGNPGIPPNYIYEGEYVYFDADEAMVLGRITVRTKQEVRDFIDKLMTYETKYIDGMWNKRVILAGDDEFHNPSWWEGPNMHCGACEALLPFISDSLYDITKIYMVSYPPFSYPTFKPDARDAFIRELNKGGFAGAFYGHGNSHQLADEKLFEDINMSQIKNNRKYFLFYFGSCTVGRFDDSDYECIGEQFVRVKDGAIGTLAATAGTDPGSNRAIGQNLFGLIADPDTDLTMGESCFIARADNLWGLHYLLIGDPATKLRKSTDRMMLEALPESLEPVEALKIIAEGEDRYFLKAFVRDSTTISEISKNTADRISGRVYREVQNGPNPNQLVPFEYTIDGKEIYQGFWDTDTAIITAPNVTTSRLPVIKLSSYFHNKSGMLDSIRIFGTLDPSPDGLGPEVVLYDGAMKLKDGDWVNKEFTLTGKVSDSSGINLINSIETTRGFYLYINQDLANKIDLRDYFLYDRNSHTTGAFNVDLVLPEPVDTVTINVADNYYNQTTNTLVLHAETSDEVSIESFLIYPNPLQQSSGLWFTFNLSRSGSVSVKIFTISGRLIKTIDKVSCHAGYNQIYWDARDDYKDDIGNGVYLVKALVSAGNDRDEAIEKFIIAR